MHKKHIELVEAVNNAKTQAEHDHAEAVLKGFRIALAEAYNQCLGVELMDCDRYYLDQGIDRPMCCGVFLDWKPVEQKSVTEMLQALPIVGVINVDNPRDPRHKEWKL